MTKAQEKNILDEAQELRDEHSEIMGAGFACVSAEREAALKYWRMFWNTLAIVRTWKVPLAMLLDCIMLAGGQYDAVRARTNMDLATRHKVTDADISKLVKRIQKRLGFPPLAGQRSLNGCDNMHSARKKQLVPAKGAK